MPLAPAPPAAPPSSEPQSAPRLRVLDLLRFLAAGAVVLFHFTARDHHRWQGGLPAEVFPELSQVTRYGYLGVHLFFVISGFVILSSAWGRPVGSFAASRVSRLYPAFWAAVLLTATLRYLWPSFEARSPAEVLVNLTMLQDLFGVPRVDGVYWTLWVELQFYLVVAVFMRIGITAPRVLAFAAAAPLLTVPATLAVPALSRTFTLVEWLPLFCAGMVVYLMRRDGPSRLAWSALGVDVGAAVLLSVVNTTSAIDQVASGMRTSPTVVALGVVACVALVAGATLIPRMAQVDSRLLTRAGLLTYPLYLTHEYTGWASIEALSSYLDPYPALLLSIGVCVLVAVLVHLVVERRVQQPMRRYLEWRLRAPQTSAALAPADLAAVGVAPTAGAFAGRRR
ncbi:acyltransferase [Cellulomonas cellasea]|uniref:acyltransferase family protein n=1 Tax=Cellulomonas cellasea TaxID=43670 RepID=UPI0025A493E4|nr:acyltransferase [Cellulomonas cellasea]MDM8083327.1 acyltransferase [Cellulomonas cellasea]